MRVKIVNAAEGLKNVHIKRTRREEVKVRPALNVKPEDLESTIARMVAETRAQLRLPGV